jgi:tetratricopeptide (TPR) repeat protein
VVSEEGRSRAAWPAAPLPSSPVFVGRERELTELHAALERAAGGRGALFLLVGEPGIGKTRLADEIGARATELEMHAIWGRCWEAEGRPPYWPWVQVIRSLVRDHSPQALAEALGPRFAHLGQIVPELRALASVTRGEGSQEGESTRFDLFDATVGMLRAAAATTPLLLVLDDLHAADLPSLSLLEFVTHELVEARILVVGTYRPVEAEPAVAGLIALIGRAGRDVPLAGLSEKEVGRFIEATAGRPVPGRLVRRIHRETEGNPFFIDEMVRVLEAGADGGRWALQGAAGLPIPHGVRGAIRQRLAPLSPECRSILAAAAVSGREFELAVLARLRETTVEALLGELGVAAVRDVVGRVPGTAGRYRFSHALVRETIYGDLPPAERMRLHRRIALLLEAYPGEPRERHLSELAHHFFEAATQTEDDRAIHYAQRAGRQAMDMLAFEEAAEQYRRALELLEQATTPEPLRRCELLLALGEAHSRAGRQDEAASTLRQAGALARELASPSLLADAALRLCGVSGLFWTEIGRSDHGLVRLLEEALAALAPDDGALRARVLARLATELVWTTSPARSEALSGEAVELARRTHDRSALAYTLLARILCVSGPDHVAERMAIVSEVLASSEATGDREVAVNALMWRIGDALQRGDVATMRAARAALIQLVRDLCQPADLWMIPTMQSQAALLEGRFEEAEQLSHAILTEPTRWANAVPMASALLYLVRREQGRLDEMTSALEGLVPQQPEMLVWRASLALLYAETGRMAEARIEVETLVRPGLDTIRRDTTWAYTLACLAEACAAASSTVEEAVAVYDALLPFADRNVVAGPIYYLGPVAYYLGVLAARLGHWGDATRHFEAARAACASLGAKPWLARVLYAHARMARAREGPQGCRLAASLVADALPITRSHGMVALRERLEALHRELEVPAGGWPPAGGAVRRAMLRREGDFWTVSFEGRVQRLRDGKGLRYLTHLLGEPGREFHVFDIVGMDEPDPPGGRSPRDRRSSAGAGGDAGAPLDAQAKRAYRERLDGLRAALDEAERANDFTRAAAARAEIEALTQELARAVGLGGRDRRMSVPSERARASVTKAIRTAIDRIGTHDPALARLLSRSIRTGTFCGYEPLADPPLAWEL